MSNGWQVLADCPHCKTECGVEEWMDPQVAACFFGIPAERLCRMCGWEERAVVHTVSAAFGVGCPTCAEPVDGAHCEACGYRPELEQVVAPADLTLPGAALAAVGRWAKAEGQSAEEFAEANLSGSLSVVVERLARGEMVPSSLDVMAFLFPGSSSGGGAERVAEEPVEAKAEPVLLEEQPFDPATGSRFLASVMLADGLVRSGEQEFLDAWLAEHQLPALRQHDKRVWRPSELGAPPEPSLAESLLEAGVELAHLDTECDESERKVLAAYARAWGVSDETLADWEVRYARRYVNVLSRLVGRLNGMVRVR